MKRKSSTILRRTIPVTKVSMVSMATRTDAFDKFMTEATSMGQVIVPTLGIKMKSKDIISRRTNEWMKFPLDIIHGQRGKHTYYLTGCNIVLHPPHVGVYHTQETSTCKPTVTQEHTLYNSNP